MLENLPKQSWSSSEMICWTVSQPHSPEIHPMKFISQSCSFFKKSLSHLISRLPRAYEMHYVISTQFISHMQIYHHAYIYITIAHKTCYAHSSSISSKISSYGLIYNYEQFDLNYSTKHIISQKYFVNTIHVYSETLGLLFTVNHPIIGSLCEPEFHGHFRPHTHHNTIYFIIHEINIQNNPNIVSDCTNGLQKLQQFDSNIWDRSNDRSRPQTNRNINKALKSRVKQVG